MTREEQVGRFVTEATEIVTGTLDADEVVRRSKSRGPSDASPEE